MAAAQAVTGGETDSRAGWVGDAWGGFAAMLVTLPSSMAYGIAVYSVLGAQHVAYGVLAGVLGAVVVGSIAPLLGGAPRVVSAPCAPAAAVLGAFVLEQARTGGVAPAQILLLVTGISLLAGVFQVGFGLAGGGRLIKYIPYPVVSGYLSGVGLLIVLGQMPKLLGVPKGTPLAEALLAPASLEWRSLVVGVVTIAAMVTARKLSKAIPSPIIGLAAGVLAYLALGLAYPDLFRLEHNQLVIGRLLAGDASLVSILTERCSALATPRLADLQGLCVPALTLAVLLSIDTLKTCVVVDAMTRTRHQSNRELVGQGVANIVASVAGGMVGAGTMGATLVNVTSGGQSRLSGMLTGVFAAVVFVALGGLVCWVPTAALAGILVVVGLRMVDRHCLHLLRQRSTVLDFLVSAAVVVVAIRVDLIAATATGLGLAILLFLREQVRGSVIRRKLHGDQVSSKQYRLPAEREILHEHGHLITLCELQGSLFFGTTDQLFTELEPDLKESRFVILDLRRVASMDFTAAHMLDQIEAMLADRGGSLVFSHLPPRLPTGQDLRAYMDQLGLVTRERNVRVFASLDEALEWAEDHVLEEHAQHGRDEETPLELGEVELFREFEADDLLPRLRECVTERSVRAGESVFLRGDPGDELLIIRRGVVRVVLDLEGDRHHVLAVFARGHFFGEVAFLDRARRSAQAIADRDTDLFVLSRARFDLASKAYPVLGVKLFARLARGLAVRLRYTDAELRAIKEA